MNFTDKFESRYTKRRTFVEFYVRRKLIIIYGRREETQRNTRKREKRTCGRQFKGKANKLLGSKRGSKCVTQSLFDLIRNL